MKNNREPRNKSPYSEQTKLLAEELIQYKNHGFVIKADGTPGQLHIYNNNLSILPN